jgi:hypothetical protein
VGISAGLVAYFLASPGLADHLAVQDELELVPADSSLLAFADVRQVMVSDLRDRLRPLVPGNGQQQFLQDTGINIETDLDRILVALAPAPAGTRPPLTPLVIARGRFDEAKVEAFMRERGAILQEHRGRRLILSPQDGDQGPAVSFIEQGLAAVGSAALVRAAIDRADGGPNVTDNPEIMSLASNLEGGNVWAVGRVDALLDHAPIADSVAKSLPAVTWFAVNGHINGGLRGSLRLETADEASATQIRDMVRGLIALARLHAPSQTEVQTLLGSLQPGGTGTTVSLAFDIPASVFDLLAPAPSARP